MATKISIGITAENLKKVNNELTIALANANILYIKLRKFHWNLRGRDFMEYHTLFEDQYEAIADAIDEIAERISSLGGVAIGTSIEFAKNSTLKEFPGKVPTNIEMLKELLADHENIIRGLRKSVDDCAEKYKDMGSSDFLTGVMANHEKMAWKLRQYLG